MQMKWDYDSTVNKQEYIQAVVPVDIIITVQEIEIHLARNNY